MNEIPQAGPLDHTQLRESLDVGGSVCVLAPSKSIALQQMSFKSEDRHTEAGVGEDVLSEMRTLASEMRALAAPKGGHDHSSLGVGSVPKVLDVLDPDQDNDGGECGTMELDESMYTLMFTAPRLISPAFISAMLVYLLAMTTLAIALVDQLSKGEPGKNFFGVPPRVETTVRMVQFLAILIGWLMEEEIPTALELLAKISRKNTHVNYNRVIFSACCRLLLGYLFLFSMFVTVVQAETVLDLFLNLLGLQFIESLDDTVYNVISKGMFGKKFEQKTTNCSDLDIKTRTNDSGSTQCNFAFWAKVLYFFNVVGLYTGFAVVMSRQESGQFQCKTLTISFADQIWEDVFVKGDENERILMYPSFSGTYVLDPNEIEHGRPVYVEQNKKDGSAFVDTKPAKFSYCKEEEAWVFWHEDIIRNKREEDTNEQKNAECPWLLKSPKTKTFDLTAVDQSGWSLWAGTILNGESLTVTCDECESNADCNFNGKCNIKDQKCSCDENLFYGTHCELKFPCEKIQDDDGNEYSIIPIESNEVKSDVSDSKDSSRIPFLTSYNRPIYEGKIDNADNTDASNSATHQNALVYAGSRWFGTRFYSFSGDSEAIEKVVKDLYNDDFHGFWDKVYEPDTGNEDLQADFTAVSDATFDNDPIGVDFSEIKFKGGDFKPFGFLQPYQDYPGQGYYHCSEERCGNMQRGFEPERDYDYALTCFDNEALVQELFQDANGNNNNDDLDEFFLPESSLFKGTNCVDSSFTMAMDERKCTCNGGFEAFGYDYEDETYHHLTGYFCHKLAKEVQADPLDELLDKYFG